MDAKTAVTGGSQRQAAEGRSTRDIILDVAERRFAEDGFAAVAVREIAAESGLKNQASLYNHFRNKRALYEAVLARGLDPLIARIMEESRKPTTLGPLLDQIVVYLAEHPHLPRLIQRAGLDDSRYLRDAITCMLRPLYEHGMRMLENTEDLWQREELPHLAAALYNMIFGYFANAGLLEMVFPVDPLSRESVERQRNFLRHAVALLLGVDEAGKPRASSGSRRRN